MEDFLSRHQPLLQTCTIQISVIKTYIKSCVTWLPLKLDLIYSTLYIFLAKMHSAEHAIAIKCNNSYYYSFKIINSSFLIA